MTVGRSLDEASLAISRALARLRAIDMASLYEAAATVAAQDHLYRQLARLVGLTVGEPHPTQRPVTADAMADAVALLGSDAGRPIPKTTLLATGIAAAAVGLPIPNPAVLKADGTGAVAIEAAAEALSLAAEIIATHRYPMARPRPSRRRGVLAHLTAEGSAIALGAQRKETTGGGKRGMTQSGALAAAPRHGAGVHNGRCPPQYAGSPRVRHGTAVSLTSADNRPRGGQGSEAYRVPEDVSVKSNRAPAAAQSRAGTCSSSLPSSPAGG